MPSRAASHPKASVSVAIPVYNGADHLDTAIRSALEQTRRPDSITVWDNASTDKSAEIATALVGPGSVRLGTTNVGAAANFRRAALESDSEFFMWLASDDILDPRAIESCLDALQRHPDLAACLPGIRFIEPGGHELRCASDPLLASECARTRLRSYLRRPRWTETYCLFRRSVLLRSPLFTGEFGSDVLLMWWFLLRGPLAVLEAPLLNYREYPRTVEHLMQALDPSAPTRHWRKCRMWIALWRHTYAAEVSRDVARVARQELVLWPFSRHGATHLLEDVLEFTGSVACRHSTPHRPWAWFLTRTRSRSRRR